jgi:hypothetical protein
MSILESDDDTAIVELDLLHTGKNRNQYYIGRDAVEKALPTFYNKPIIYRLNNEFMPELATDVVEHGTIEERTMRIAGTIPESAPMEFVERDGKEYLRTKGVIYKIYQPSLMNILQNRDGNVKVSIEIYVTDKDEMEDGTLEVKDFRFEGVALLGENILEGIEGSQMNVVKFSAEEFNEHYLKFSQKEIPESVRETARKALQTREERGKGGSTGSISMAKYLANNETIDYVRLGYLKDYFRGHYLKSNLSYSLYGGDAALEWLEDMSKGRKVNNSMNNISVDAVRKGIYEYLDEISDNGWRYYIDSIYVEPKQVVIGDCQEDKTYLVEYSIEADGKISVLWDSKSEILRCYVKTDEVGENTILCKMKDLFSLDENGQLISNTHRLSSVDSTVAKKAGELLNSLEKEGEDMDEKKEFSEEEVEACKNAEETETNCDNVEKNCDETKLNAESEAEKTEDEEKAEDKDEDKKEEEDESEDFAAKINALTKENEELKASLDTYKRQEELTKMNALIEEFSYCFKAEDKDELVKDLEHKTFAEVETIVNEAVKKFAKENKPEEEKKENKFSIGLLANTFSYKKDEKKESRTLKDIKEQYSK